MHPIDFLKIKTWIEQWNVDYKIGVDGTLDIEDDIEISGGYEKLPYKFGYCNGSFRVGGIGLKTLENCPEYILDYFSCSFNNLTSLKYCPKEVGGDIFMRSCGITEIDYFPKLIDQNSTKFIDLSHNKISKLKNLPILYQKKIDYSIDISYNKLNSLEGCPDSLLTLECVGNPIKNFKGLKNCKNLICSIDGIENAEDFCFSLPENLEKLYIIESEISSEIFKYNLKEIKKILHSNLKLEHIIGKVVKERDYIIYGV